MADLTYTTDDFFVTFYPENEAAEIAWGQMLDMNEGCAKFPMAWLPQIRQQLKNSGYTVRKMRKTKPVTLQEIDSMLAELEA